MEENWKKLQVLRILQYIDSLLILSCRDGHGTVEIKIGKSRTFNRDIHQVVEGALHKAISDLCLDPPQNCESPLTVDC